MPTGHGTPATRAQQQRNGHVAAVFRQLLKERDWSPRDFNHAIGKEAGHTGIYQWLNAKAAPGPDTAAEIHKKLGIPISDMTPAGSATTKAKKPKLSKQSSVAALRAAANGKTWVEPPPNAVTVAPPQTHPRRLYFTVDGDGLATLKLDVTMPVDALFPVLTILYNAGLVAQKQIEPPP
jgi:hypothetical protein